MAWLPTLDELKNRTYSRLRDSEKAFVLDSSVQQWLNEALLDINARLRLKRATATGTSSASGVVTFPGSPEDLVEIMNLWFGLDPVTMVDNDTWKSYSKGALNTGSNILGRVVNNTIETYPAQASESYELEYIQRPTEMDNGTDQPDIAPELAMRLPWYAIAEAKYQEGEFEEGDRFMALYMEGLPGRPRSTYRLHPQPLNLIPEQGWFDTNA